MQKQLYVYFEILSFFQVPERIPLQALNKRFYSKIVPRMVPCISIERPDRKTLTLFHKGDIRQFRLDNMSWIPRKPDQTSTPGCLPFKFSFTVELPLQKFLIIGGVNEKDQRQSTMTAEWISKSDTFTYLDPWKLPRSDVSLAYEMGSSHVYIVGGPNAS